MVTAEEKKVLCDPGSDEEFLERIYQSELGRALDSEGHKYWIDDMNINGETREKVLINVRLSNEKWLRDTYKTELGRELDDEGRNWWMGDFRGKGSGKEHLTYGSDRPVQTREQVLANIRRSEEYKAKTSDK